MNYKLLKSIPLAKEGTMVGLTYDEDEVPYIFDVNNRILTYLNESTINEWIEPIVKDNTYDLAIFDSFWYIDYYSIEIRMRKIDNQESYNNHYLPALRIGNVYASKEQAQKALDKILAISSIKEYCNTNNIQLYTDDEVRELVNNNIETYPNVRPYRVISHSNDKFVSEHLTRSFYDTPFKFITIDDADKVIANCKDALNIIYNVN